MNGRPSALENSVTGRLTDDRRRPLGGGYFNDSEAIRIDRAADKALVAFEGLARIEEYDLDRGMIRASPRRLFKKDPPRSGGGRNRDFEGLALYQPPIGDRKLLVFSEGWTGPDGSVTGYLVTGGIGQPLYLKQRDGFSPTDIAFLPNGDLLVLERDFNPPLDISMRLRLIDRTQVSPGTIMDGEVLLTAGLAQNIDNMEGLAIHTGSDGYPVLTLVSDNNFNWLLQRTVLLQFRLLRKFPPVDVTPPQSRPAAGSG